MRLIDADALINDILTDYGCDPKYIADETIDGLKPYTDQLLLDRIGLQPTIPAPRWVRCEEPPKGHMWCFVYTDEPDMIMPIRIAFYTASCTGKGSWYHYESGSDITDEVDYWMEMRLEGPKLDHDLPWPIEPPKEVK